MPLRSDPSLWFNLPGVVAAYQPVRAPDSLSARYNMAHGGDSRYRAEPGVLPAWSGVAGWTFDGSAQYLAIPQSTVVSTPLSLLVVCTCTNTASANVPLGVSRTASGGGAAYNCHLVSFRGDVSGDPVRAVTIAGIANPNTWATAAIGGYTTTRYCAAAVFASASLRAISINGGSTGTDSTIATPAAMDRLCIGAVQYWNSAVIMQEGYFSGSIQAAMLVNRPLSPAEVWSTSRQMFYCDVDRDWSVWSPRRKWFTYVLAAPAGRAGIYGARPTVALPGGVRIVPQDEGGVNG